MAHEAGIKADSGFVLGDADVQPTGNTPPDSLNVLRARWNATPDDESAARTLTRFLLRNNEADEAARFAKKQILVISICGFLPSKLFEKRVARLNL